MSDVFCQEQSLAISEPLHGTAVAATDRWLFLEHDGPWGPRGVEDSGLPTQVAEQLTALSAQFASLRVQLIRRPVSVPPTAARLIVAELSEQGGAVAAQTLDSVDALLSVPLSAWLRGEAHLPGTPVRDPLYFVCVHGKRDRCCARLGMPVYRAIEAQVGERVFQTTHLGGHRFAATLLVLPSGLCYGRVAADEASALVQATERGEIHDVARLRGRTLYTREAQAAEVLLRERLADGRTAALALVAQEESEHGARVRFRSAVGEEHEVIVRRERLAPAPASCGGKPKAGEQLIASLVR